MSSETKIDFSKLSHEYDPLGMIFDAIQSSFMITTCNMPKPLILTICSYLEYIETTMDGEEKPGVSTFAPGEDAYELCVVINTPKATVLPHNTYILSDIIFAFRGPMHRKSLYYAGIQLFDENNYQEPGKGTIMYKSDIMNSVDMCKLLSMNIELKCNQSYLFFVKQIDYVDLDSRGLCIRLVDTLNPSNRSILRKLKFCSTIFWYPSREYGDARGYINFFKIHFRCKG
eukprot:UN10203